MNKEDFTTLDKQWFTYGNSIHSALNNKEIKQARKFLEEWFERYTQFKDKCVKEVDHE